MIIGKLPSDQINCCSIRKIILSAKPLHHLNNLSYRERERKEGRIIVSREARGDDCFIYWLKERERESEVLYYHISFPDFFFRRRHHCSPHVSHFVCESIKIEKKIIAVREKKQQVRERERERREEDKI